VGSLTPCTAANIVYVENIHSWYFIYNSPPTESSLELFLKDLKGVVTVIDIYLKFINQCMRVLI
jgi:hypothetical protein